MSKTLFFVKDFLPNVGVVLRPYYRSSTEMAEGMRSGVVYKAVISNPRNPKHHRKYWGLCGLVKKNTGFRSDKEVSNYFKIKCGLVDFVVVDGVTYLVPRSIAFESMDQEAFEAFYENFESIAADVLGCSVDDIRSNVIFEM